MKNLPFIHLFKTSQGRYLYDVNRDQIVQVSPFVYDDLKSDPTSCGSTPESKASILKLRDIGFLKTNRVNEVEHPDTELLPFYLQNKMAQLILQVTQGCNLRCEYCAYSGKYANRVHSGKKMSFETAKKSIDYFASHSRDSRKLAVSFYGGEPLLRYEFIRQCIAYCEKVLSGKEVSFNITTNGTLLTDEMIDFFASKNLRIMFSLDGPRNIHDRNRKFASTGKGSFDVLMNNIKKIQKRYPEYYSKCISYNAVIDTKDCFETINKFVMGHEIFHDVQFMASVVSSRYASESIEINSGFVEEWQYEEFKFYLSKLNRFPAERTSILIKPIFNSMCITCLNKKYENTVELPSKWHHGGPCKPGVLRLFVSTDGDFYPCERLSEESTVSCIGRIDCGVDLERAVAVLNVEKIMHKKCMNCWAYRHCTICVGAVDGLDKMDPQLANQ